MTLNQLELAIRRLKVETGSLACLGCGYEHDCGTRGCAILREAETAVKNLSSVFVEETVLSFAAAVFGITVEDLRKAVGERGRS